MSTTITSAAEALARLREGNQRFISNVRSIDALASQSRRSELAGGQHPFAVILGCSDSRAPAEILFDQGLGDLFVIRVAGNIVAPSQVGSVELAVELFGTRLVVVMGHSLCGAVAATVNAVRSKQLPASHNISSIVNRIRPSVESVLEAGNDADERTLMRRSVRANVRASASQLRHASERMEKMIANEGLRVIGAEYDLESGVVDFFDGSVDNGG